MKRKALLVVFSLLFIAQLTCAKYDKNIGQKNDRVEHVALKNCGSNSCSSYMNNCGELTSCKRGKKGKKGHRGRQGPAGDPGMGELFINALMINWYSEGVYPPDARGFLSIAPYSVATLTPAWILGSTEFNGESVRGMSFDIPIDLDRTKPVTVVVHFLVDNGLLSDAGQGKLRVYIDYQPNGGIIGVTPPGTDFADVQDSADFIITPAIPSGSGNYRHQSVAISLDPTKIDGDWAFMALGRIAPAANEYSAQISLSTVSVQYSRLMP